MSLEIFPTQFYVKLKKLQNFNRKIRIKPAWVCLIIIQIIKLVVGDESYCYNDVICGPANWEGVCQTGVMQSPINIPAAKVTKLDGSAKITLNRNYAIPKLFFVKNTGKE
jgi:carbonic anhydrase